MHYTTLLFPTLLAITSRVAAHGYVASITVSGTSYPGGNPANVYTTPAPKVAGWAANNLDNGFVAPDEYQNPDIICHKNATPGQAYVPVKPGDTVGLVWNTWPDSHHGPVIDYLASCNGACTTVDKTKLSFAKIDATGLISGSNPGTWATDQLIANKFTWNFKVPTSLKAGNYVLRHEIIALHSASNADGAQNYPQCINLQVSGGSGTAVPSGEAATSFYKETDPGIEFNLYTSFSSYQMPGPAVWSGSSKREVEWSG